MHVAESYTVCLLADLGLQHLLRRKALQVECTAPGTKRNEHGKLEIVLPLFSPSFPPAPPQGTPDCFFAIPHQAMNCGQSTMMHDAVLKRLTSVKD